MSEILSTQVVRLLLLWIVVAVIVCVLVGIFVGTVFLMRYAYRKLNSICEQKKQNGEDCIDIVTLIMFCIIVFALILFVVVIAIHSNTCAILSDYTLTRFGKLGDYFGGFIGTLVAVIVAIYAIRTYKAERESQKGASVSAMLSTMLDLHKQNVKEIEIIDRNNSPKKLKGREAFRQLVEELNWMYNLVYEAINDATNKNPDLYAEWTQEISKKRLAHILSFGYFFYSVDSYVITREAGSPLFFLCEEVRAAILGQKILGDLKNLQRHIILGHYFRHLFNMVSYIDTNTFTEDYEKKAFFVKLIRSQLSDYEQVLLYYNSLSTLGFDWNKDLGMTKIKEMNLLCKYRLLKNCPTYIQYFGIHPINEMYVTEAEAWLKEKNEFLFETAHQGQLEAFNAIMNS